MNLKRFTASLLAITMVLAMAACGSKPAADSSAPGATSPTGKEPVELVYYHCKAELTSGFEELAAGFNKEFPEYKVVMEPSHSGGRQEKFASGNPPAMMYSLDYSSLQLKTFLDNNLLVPVEDLELFDSVMPKHKEGLVFPDGHIYAVPILNCGKGIMYNAELFTKAGITKIPTTTDELWAACDKLEAIGVKPFVGGHQEPWTIKENVWRVFFCQNTDPDFTQKRIAGEVKFADELIPKWVKWIDQYKKYSLDPILEINWPTALGELVQEKAAMIINGPWAILSINEMDPAIGAKFRMIGDITTNDPKKNVIIEDVDNHMLIVNTTPEQVEGSKKFLNWVATSPTAKGIFTKSLNYTNPLGIEIEGTAVDQDVMKEMAAGNTMFATVGLNVPAGWELEVAILTQKYILNELTAEELGIRIDEAWDTMYANV